mmetsp:Transcript_81996/g.219382  ORF Transcript_81996/g.219382 Transcript_81996/m.219382 type:complete len:224 (+) Transcript_81996:1445-2116(+)
MTPGVAVEGQADQWGPYSACPSGHKAVGLARLDLMSTHHEAEVNDFHCDIHGCHAWCHKSDCWVTARCAQAPGLEVTSGPLIRASPDQWSEFSNCPSGYFASGLARVNLIGDDIDDDVNDFECNEHGCRVWCESSECEFKPRCVKAPGLSVVLGPTVTGEANHWSPVSVCPEGSVALSLSKVKIHGGGAEAQVNDLRCTNEGCDVWCRNQGCSVRSTCAKYGA